MSVFYGILKGLYRTSLRHAHTTATMAAESIQVE